MRAILLDLAGEAGRARAWVEAASPGASVDVLDKAELKAGGKREVLARIRSRGRSELFGIFCNRLDLQPSLVPMMVFGLLAGARRVRVGDMEGRSVERGWAGVALVELPKLAVELLVGYGVVVPLAWLSTWWLGARARRRGHRRPNDGPLDILYLRATPAATSAVGGSTSHVAGTVNAFAEMGHRVRFIANDRLLEVDHDVMPLDVVPPDARFGTVRAIFEVWNSLRFGWRAKAIARSRPAPDLVYQRYSRFNAAGVLLAVALDRPLCLEFNGSEVWVAENWDPVGQRLLLAAIERLNLRAADRIVVVSHVLAEACAKAGADRERIVVNPNGADADRFRPGVGGAELRARLFPKRENEAAAEGVTEQGDEIIAGFLGTFGPWHGVDALAEAIVKLPRDVPVRFLLVGDGDRRPGVERRIAEGGVTDRVVFAGRIPHSEVPAYLDACDILLSPHVPMPDGSAFFGSPTKLFEYMAMEKAIAASRLGQIGDVIEDGVSGLLLEPGSVDELVAAIEKLAGDAELRERLGRAARATVLERYTWRASAKRATDFATAPRSEQTIKRATDCPYRNG